MSYEIGGWHNLEAIRLSVAATWDEQHKFRVWWEQDAADLVRALFNEDLIVGYNLNTFDYRVLTLYDGLAPDLSSKTFDLLREIRLQGLPLVGLNSIAKRNIGASKLYKSADAVTLFRDNRLDELERYVKQDVALVRQVAEHWEKTGFLWVDDTRYAIWPGYRVTEVLEVQ